MILDIFQFSLFFVGAMMQLLGNGLKESKCRADFRWSRRGIFFFQKPRRIATGIVRISMEVFRNLFIKT